MRGWIPILQEEEKLQESGLRNLPAIEKVKFLAIIKGTRRYRPSDDDDEDRDLQQQSRSPENEEPQQRRGGIIKGTRSPSSADFSLTTGLISKSLPQKTHSRILKAAQASLIEKQRKEKLFQEENVFGDISDFPEAPKAGRNQPPEFQPVSFQATEKGEGPRNVVMIPSSDRQYHSMNDTEEPPDDIEFQVDQPVTRLHVDVDGIVAEAEQKGREKAQKIIEHAQDEAKKLIDQAKIYGESAKQESQREGFKLGKEEGYKAALEEFVKYMDEAKSLITQLVREREQVLNSVEPELARLSVSIAEKIIGEELQINRDTVLNIIKNAMQKVKSSEEVTIKVNPDDLDYVNENKDVFSRLVEGLKNLEVTSDPRVDRGGCMIETNLGSADARVSTQLEAIELAFKSVTESSGFNT